MISKQMVTPTGLEPRTRLQHRRRSQQADMLLDQSVMRLRKATNWWCDSGRWNFCL